MYEYIKPETPDEKILKMLAEPMELVDSNYLVVSHSHIPFSRKLGTLTIINPGSVGQPRDGDTRTGCAVFDTKTGDVEFFRLEYNIEAVCSKIEERMPKTDEMTAILRRGY